MRGVFTELLELRAKDMIVVLLQDLSYKPSISRHFCKFIWIYKFYCDYFTGFSKCSSLKFERENNYIKGTICNSSQVCKKSTRWALMFNIGHTLYSSDLQCFSSDNPCLFSFTNPLSINRKLLDLLPV